MKKDEKRKPYWDVGDKKIITGLYPTRDLVLSENKDEKRTKYG